MLALENSFKTIADESAWIQSIWTEIRRDDRYTNAMIVFMPESNLAKESDHMASYVEHFPQTIMMREAKHGRVGVPKTWETTNEMTELFKRYLFDNNIGFAKNMLAIPPMDFQASTRRGRNTPEARAHLVRTLYDQLSRYRYDLPKDKGGKSDSKTKYKLTGKMGAKNDDLAITVLMLPYWVHHFYKTPRVEYAQCKSIERTMGY